MKLIFIILIILLIVTVILLWNVNNRFNNALYNSVSFRKDMITMLKAEFYVLSVSEGAIIISLIYLAQFL